MRRRMRRRMITPDPGSNPHKQQDPTSQKDWLNHKNIHPRPTPPNSMIESMVCLKSYGANSSWDNQIFLIRQKFTQDRHCLQNLRTQKYLPSAWMGGLYRDNCTLCPSNFYLMKSTSQRLITYRKSNCDSIAQLTKLEQKKACMYGCIYILHMCI